MFKPGASDDRAALAFDDMASALDAGLPIETIGGNPSLGDHVLLDLAWQRGIKLSPTEKTALEAGWKSGNATQALRARAENRRRRAEFWRLIYSGLRYPALLLFLLPITGFAVLAVIGPGFLIALGVTYAVLALLVFVVVRKLKRGDASLEQIPILGDMLTDVRELPYLETFHSLYGAGVPIIEAHRQAVAGVRMHGLQERLIMAQKLLEDGAPLQEALHSSASLTQETRTLLATGEKSGTLEDALDRALNRRSDVAARKLATAANRLGMFAYALATIFVIIVVFQFYSGYFAMLRG